MKTASWIGVVASIALLASGNALAADITIDARDLTFDSFILSGGTACLDSRQVQPLTLIPGS